MFGVFGVIEYIFPLVLAASVIFLMVNRDLIRVARIKTVAVYGLLIVLCGMIQCVYNKPAVMESNVGEVFTYCADYKAGGGFSGGILCKVLSPIGAIGTFVILMILAIICIVIITEKSFVSGLKNVKKSSQRMMQEAKEDYSAYRQHSASLHENDMSDEEYHRLREEERARARLRKIEKKEKQLAEKKAREEYLANARMNNVVRGVTSDTLITGDVQPEPEIDIHEIEVDRERKDEYSADIYEPDNRMKPVDKAQVIVEICIRMINLLTVGCLYNQFRRYRMIITQKNHSIRMKMFLTVWWIIIRIQSRMRMRKCMIYRVMKQQIILMIFRKSQRQMYRIM